MKAEKANCLTRRETKMFQACFKDDGKIEKSVVLILGNNGYNNLKVPSNQIQKAHTLN